jgi:16S rRNA processing protein RimM
MQKKYIEVGKIVNTHGIKGEVKINPWCDSPKFLKKFDGFFLTGDGKDFHKAESLRVTNETVTVKFEGIDNVESASSLRNKIVYIDRDWVELPKGSFFEQDIIGLSVKDAESGEVYGTVGEVAKTGANDIYRVDKDGREYWIPAVKQIVKSIDTESGIMLVTPIKGLFDDEN